MRYIDQIGWELFDELDGQEVHVQTLVSGKVGEVYDAWVEKCWKHSHFPVETQLGTGRGQALGCVRIVPGGIREKIVRVGEPSSDQDLIPSISYRVISGPFPADEHLGIVRFIPDQTSGSTLVCWDIKYVPSALGNVLCCGGTMIRLVARNVVQQTLTQLSNHFQTKSATAN